MKRILSLTFITFLTLSLFSQSFIGHTKADVIKEIKSYNLSYTEQYTDELGHIIELNEADMIQWVIFHKTQDVCVSEIYLPQKTRAFNLFKESLDEQYEIAGYNRWKVYHNNMIITVQLFIDDVSMFVMQCSNCSN